MLVPLAAVHMITDHFNCAAPLSSADMTTQAAAWQDWLGSERGELDEEKAKEDEEEVEEEVACCEDTEQERKP